MCKTSRNRLPSSRRVRAFARSPLHSVGQALFSRFFTALRFAFGLVCLGGGLLMTCHWLGFIPDDRRLMDEARAQKCDALAITTAGMIRASDWANLEATFWTLTHRDPNLLTIGLRTDKGLLRVDSGKHRDLWSIAGTESGYSKIQVPISLNQRHWGQLEFCFANRQLPGVWGWLDQPIIKILAFFLICGSFVYSLFIGRALGIFESVQVVPDRVRQALNTLAEGLLVLDEREKIILANEAFATKVGIAAEELRGRLVTSLSWVQDQTIAAGEYPWRQSDGGKRTKSEQLIRYRIDDNQQCIFSINSAPIESSDRGHRGTLVTLRDVTLLEHNRAELEAMLAVLKENRDEISRKNRELEILATQDSLTGCFNRRAFFERFDIAFRFSKQYNVPLSCVMVDNDHFKSVNDNFGHHIGDEVLRKVGTLLRKLHSDAQVVCRFGGEEFCIMLPGYSLADAAAAAEKIRQGIMAIRLEDPADLRLSASIGVSDMTFGATEPQTLINQADACLYVAKRSGRNRVVCYDPSMADIDTEASEPRVDKHAPKKQQDVLSPSSPPVRSLLSALAFRDADTAEHSRRVANHCVRTGKGILNEEELNLIEVAGLLHDIGKIGVPDHILLKPGALTDAEWKLMGLHDQISVEIVANLIESEDLLSIIRFHHCKFGGGHGSSEGPVGETIPVAARILTIADSYDAMVSDRVYRKGRTHEEAITELRRCAGRQFDPEWVERFVASFDSADSPASPQGSESNQAVHAVHFSKQVERLVEAVGAHDSKFVKNLSERVRKIATGYQLDDVAVAALKLESSVDDENQQWESILEQTEKLIDVCRAAQDRMIRFD